MIPLPGTPRTLWPSYDPDPISSGTAGTDDTAELTLPFEPACRGPRLGGGGRLGSATTIGVSGKRLDRVGELGSSAVGVDGPPP